MSASTCPRSWEVEAARLGQLRGKKLDAHREHIAAGCAQCAREATYLDRLGPWLRRADVRQDEVALRRLRQSTLAAAHRLARSAERARKRGAVSILLGCCAALAVWSLASAGEHDARELPPQAATAGVVAQAEPAPAPLQLPASVAPLPRTEREPASPPPVAPARSTKAPRPHVQAARAAVSASVPGAERAPAPALIDPRAGEDAAYLRVMRLWRAQRVEGAQLAAADYLARFPEGFRRIEVERLLAAIHGAVAGAQFFSEVKASPGH